MALRYFLACLVVLSCLVSAQPPMYGLLGQEVHLKPVFTGHPDDILWKHDGNKVVEFNGKEEHVYSRYQSRVTLDWVSAELDIKDLRHEDSGEYELEIYVNEGIYRLAYNLEVIDKVTKPSVSCDLNSSSSDTGGTWATLTCFAEPTQPLSSLKYEYEWESSGNVIPGPQLTILLEDEPDDQIYTCRVRNPLTFETTTFAATSCSPDTSSSVALAVSLTFIIIFIMLLVGVVFCKLKNKACFAKSNRDDVENRRSATEETDHGDEKTQFLHRAPTLPSQQRLRPWGQAHSDAGNGLPADNHREHAAADLDRGEESNKEETEIEYTPEKTFGVKLKPTPLKCALPYPDHQVESKRKHESESERQLDSRAAEEEESEGKTEEDRPPTSPEQNMPDTAPGEHHSKLSEGETQAKEDDQPEMNKTVSGDKRESDGEETEILCEDTSQSPTPKNADNTQTNTFEKSPNANIPDPDPKLEGESKQESESEGQLDSSEAEEEESEGKTEEDRPPTSPEQNMPDTAPGEHHSKLSEGEIQAKEDDQPEMNKTVSGDKRESDGEETEILCEDTSQSPTPKNADNTQTNTFEKSPNANIPDPDPKLEGESKHESDCEGQLYSRAAEEEESEGKPEEDRPPTSPEQNMPDTASDEHQSKLSEGETQAKEDDQTERNKTVSRDKRESDGEETEENRYTYSSQSPTPNNTDNTRTNTFEKPPNDALPDLDHQGEGESKQKSESEGQSDSSAAEEEDEEGKTEEKTKDECDSKEEKPANMSESEDKEGGKKTEAVEK